MLAMFIPRDQREQLKQVLSLSTIGLELGLSIAVGYFGGRWLDGKLAFEKKDVRMRDVSDLKVECIWINIYHGGTWSSPSDDHLFIDNIVIAKKYVGPIQKKDFQGRR